MFTKITDKEINALKIGNIIVKYPIDGRPTKTIDINDSTQLLVMQVGQIVDENINLLFQVPEEGIFIGLMEVNMGPLHKTKDELVSDDKWWLYTK